PGNLISEALDVNSVGQVVGLSVQTGSPSSDRSAFLWDDGQLKDLGHLGDTFRNTIAYAVNDAGAVVGSSRLSPFTCHAFLWQNGVFTDLASMTGESWCIAPDISEIGYIVGPFLWDGAEVTRFGTLGGEITQAFGVNEAGQTAGWSERIVGERVLHAFLWDNGNMVDLGAAGGFDSSKAEAINNGGQVVGSPGFLYDPESGMHHLQDLLPPDPRWFRYELNPQDINDSGQIVGAGSFPSGRHAFLMTPIDTDFDNDGDTDLLDFAALHSCLSGPNTALNEECRMRDIDRNGVVDLKDFRVFQWSYSPP
ncbi:MAG: DUF3466 family protein, partial [Planctomycetes bacterium]|nr:DUF3466 family protein [Planctomycetota bacterium]